MMGILIAIGVILLVITAGITDSNEPNNVKKITLDEINVGDKLLIKGEKFTVTNYTPDGMVELLNDGGVYYVDLGNEITFRKYIHSKYIEVIGFKGTVKSGYLNKLKV